MAGKQPRSVGTTKSKEVSHYGKGMKKKRAIKEAVERGEKLVEGLGKRIREHAGPPGTPKS